MSAHKYTFVLTSLAALSGCEGQGGAKPAAELTATADAPTVGDAPAPAAATHRAPASAGQLTLVKDASEVCMVNNQFMGRAQIPVLVDGKTYFGCCEMCKGRLTRDASARVAKDPVSGNVVDKSSAVIAKRENGDVLYFENAQNLERFQAGAI